MVQIKQKRGTGVESPSPRSFSGGVMSTFEIVMCTFEIVRERPNVFLGNLKVGFGPQGERDIPKR